MWLRGSDAIQFLACQEVEPLVSSVPAYNVGRDGWVTESLFPDKLATSNRDRPVTYIIRTYTTWQNRFARPNLSAAASYESLIFMVEIMPLRQY